MGPRLRFGLPMHSALKLIYPACSSVSDYAQFLCLVFELPPKSFQTFEFRHWMHALDGLAFPARFCVAIHCGTGRQKDAPSERAKTKPEAA